MTRANRIRIALVVLTLALMAATCTLSPAQAQQRVTRYPQTTRVSRYVRPTGVATARPPRRRSVAVKVTGIPLATQTPAPTRSAQ